MFWVVLCFCYFIQENNYLFLPARQYYKWEVISLGGVVSVKGKAQNAADAASLSAAYEIAHFSISKACSSARIAAQKNGAVLESCKYTNNDVEVIVSIDQDGEIIKAIAKADIK